jgi:hypothetical protein
MYASSFLAESFELSDLDGLRRKIRGSRESCGTPLNRLDDFRWEQEAGILRWEEDDWTRLEDRGILPERSLYFLYSRDYHILSDLKIGRAATQVDLLRE